METSWDFNGSDRDNKYFPETERIEKPSALLFHGSVALRKVRQDLSAWGEDSAVILQRYLL